VLVENEVRAMATGDNNNAIDNGGVKRVRNADKTIEFRPADELLKLQQDQKRREGKTATFVRGISKR
jgi:hypothetical protein